MACEPRLIGGVAGGGLAGAYYGIFCASMGPGGWVGGVLLGGLCGLLGGCAIVGMTKTSATKEHLQSLNRLFQKEVNFVLQNQNALSLRIRQAEAGSIEHQQLIVLEKHFNWVLARERDISTEGARVEYEEWSKYREEIATQNREQAVKRGYYVGSTADAYRAHPDRQF